MSTTTDKMTKFQERRSSDVVEKLLTERKVMLALYCRMAGIEPYSTDDDKNSESDQKMLQEFCQVLIDYIAAGHFSLYERIINGQERRRSVADEAKKLYPRIAESTQIAVDFNDKYDCEDYCDITEDFTSDLSYLGEQLAGRIELEDQLIDILNKPPKSN